MYSITFCLWVCALNTFQCLSTVNRFSFFANSGRYLLQCYCSMTGLKLFIQMRNITMCLKSIVQGHATCWVLFCYFFQAITFPAWISMFPNALIWNKWSKVMVSCHFVCILLQMMYNVIHTYLILFDIFVFFVRL